MDNKSYSESPIKLQGNYQMKLDPISFATMCEPISPRFNYDSSIGESWWQDIIYLEFYLKHFDKWLQYKKYIEK